MKKQCRTCCSGTFVGVVRVVALKQTTGAIGCLQWSLLFLIKGLPVGGDSHMSLYGFTSVSHTRFQWHSINRDTALSVVVVHTDTHLHNLEYISDEGRMKWEAKNRTALSLSSVGTVGGVEGEDLGHCEMNG